jgi:hypothetical protein
MTPLILKRASASRSSGQWRDDDYDVLENGVVVGRIFTCQSLHKTALGCGPGGGNCDQERDPTSIHSGNSF